MKHKCQWYTSCVKSGVALLGFVFVGLGTIGIFVPGIPTTIFILLAAYCFSRSCPGLYRWLVEHKRFGPIVDQIFIRREMPIKLKQKAIFGLWGTLLLSLFLTQQQPWFVALCITLLIVGVGVSSYILFGIKTQKFSR